MPKVQQRTLALFGFIPADDTCLHLHRPQHRPLPRGPVIGKGRRSLLQPVKERGVAQKAVFDHFTVACQKITPGQRAQHINVGQHMGWLMKCTHQILALRGVDPGLAPDRAVNLRQQRGRNLHKPHTPAQDCCRKAHQIADNAATKGDHHVAAFHLLFQQPFHALRQMHPAFGAFTRWQDQRRGCNAGICKGGLQPLQMQGCDLTVSHNRHTLARQKRRNLRARLFNQARADQHLIAAGAQINMNTVNRHGVCSFSTSGRAARAAAT